MTDRLEVMIESASGFQ